jgi:hypothetical protein
VGYIANQKIYGIIILIIGPLKAKDIQLVKEITTRSLGNLQSACTPTNFYLFLNDKKRVTTVIWVVLQVKI